MDDTEIQEIARRLTAMWVTRHAQRRTQRPRRRQQKEHVNPATAQFQARLLSAHETVLAYEDWDLQVITAPVLSEFIP
jgi:hypothetical protein